MAQPNSPDMLPEHTKKAELGRIKHNYCQQQTTACPVRCDGNTEEMTD